MIDLKKKDIQIGWDCYNDGPNEEQTIIRHEGHKWEELKQQILQDHEDAKKLREQEYIYEKNFEKVNDITKVEYDKYSSLCVTMTWISNELHRENKDRQIVKRLEEERQSNLKLLELANKDKDFNAIGQATTLVLRFQKILEGEKK